MTDNFRGTQDNPTAPITRMWAIEPHNTNPLAKVTRGIHANTDGTVVARALNSSVDVSLTVTAGGFYPYRLTHVRATGTDAEIIGGA